MSVGAIMGEISSDQGARAQAPVEVANSEAIDTQNKALQIAARQPAAVVSTKLADLLIQERRGDDILRGKPGDDVMLGGGGDDRLLGAGGVDDANGGPGTDFCRAETTTACELP